MAALNATELCTLLEYYTSGEMLDATAGFKIEARAALVDKGLLVLTSSKYNLTLNGTQYVAKVLRSLPAVGR